MKDLQKKIIDFLEENFELEKLEMPNEYRYQSIPLCVIDAIFSIGAKYTSTANTVEKYCQKFNLKEIRDEKEYPNIGEQHTITQFIENIRNFGVDNFAKEINKQRTSSRNGILKIEAALQWAEILKSHNIETFQDYLKSFDETTEKELRSVKGQASGISLAYFKMLCGDEKLLKPDRHILRFLKWFSDKDVSAADAQNIISSVVEELSKKYKNINVRTADYQIWNYMKNDNKKQLSK